MLHKNDESLHHFARRYDLIRNRIFPNEFPLTAVRGMAKPYNLSEKNRALLHEFYLHNEAVASLSLARRVRILMLLATVGEMLGEKSFDALTREDVQQMVAQIRQHSGWSEVTANYHIKAVKKFLKHLNGGDEYPSNISWLKIKERKNTPIKKEDLITEEEMARILQVNTNSMHRCLLALLWEGLRVSEVGTLRCKNINFEGREVYVSVKGKTGERTVMSIGGMPHIRQWMSQHPTQKPEDWLFVISSNYNRGQRLGYWSIRKIVRQACEKAGLVGRRTHPHVFRHSSITDRRRKGMRQREASAFYGVSGQVMTQVYDHLCDTDVQNEIRRVLGGNPVPEIVASKMEPKHCSICNISNPHFAMSCGNCGNAFSEADTIKQRDEFKVLKEENELIRTQMNAMQAILTEFTAMVKGLPGEKKREILEKMRNEATTNDSGSRSSVTGRDGNAPPEPRGEALLSKSDSQNAFGG